MTFLGNVFGLAIAALFIWVYVQWMAWALHATGYIDQAATWGHSFTIMLPLFIMSSLLWFMKEVAN